MFGQGGVNGVLCDCFQSSAHLRILFDRVADLLVKNAPVGHHYDRVENVGVIRLESNKLMGQPGDGITFATAS